MSYPRRACSPCPSPDAGAPPPHPRGAPPPPTCRHAPVIWLWWHGSPSRDPPGAHPEAAAGGTGRRVAVPPPAAERRVVLSWESWVEHDAPFGRVVAPGDPGRRMTAPPPAAARGAFMGVLGRARRALRAGRGTGLHGSEDDGATTRRGGGVAPRTPSRSGVAHGFHAGRPPVPPRSALRSRCSPRPPTESTEIGGPISVARSAHAPLAARPPLRLLCSAHAGAPPPHPRGAPPPPPRRHTPVIGFGGTARWWHASPRRVRVRRVRLPRLSPVAGKRSGVRSVRSFTVQTRA